MEYQLKIQIFHVIDLCERPPCGSWMQAAWRWVAGCRGWSGWWASVAMTTPPWQPTPALHSTLESQYNMIGSLTDVYVCCIRWLNKLIKGINLYNTSSQHKCSWIGRLMVIPNMVSHLAIAFYKTLYRVKGTSLSLTFRYGSNENVQPVSVRSKQSRRPAVCGHLATGHITAIFHLLPAGGNVIHQWLWDKCCLSNKGSQIVPCVPLPLCFLHIMSEGWCQ